MVVSAGVEDGVQGALVQAVHVEDVIESILLKAVPGEHAPKRAWVNGFLGRRGYGPVLCIGHRRCTPAANGEVAGVGKAIPASWDSGFAMRCAMGDEREGDAPIVAIVYTDLLDDLHEALLRDSEWPTRLGRGDAEGAG